MVRKYRLQATRMLGLDKQRVGAYTKFSWSVMRLLQWLSDKDNTSILTQSLFGYDRSSNPRASL